MEKSLNKEVSLDFVDVAYRKLERLFEDGISVKEFRRKAGLLFSLERKQSDALLRIMLKRYPHLKLKTDKVFIDWFWWSQLRCFECGNELSGNAKECLICGNSAKGGKDGP